MEYTAAVSHAHPAPSLCRTAADPAPAHAALLDGLRALLRAHPLLGLLLAPLLALLGAAATHPIAPVRRAQPAPPPAPRAATPLACDACTPAPRARTLMRPASHARAAGPARRAPSGAIAPLHPPSRPRARPPPTPAKALPRAPRSTPRLLRYINNSAPP